MIKSTLSHKRFSGRFAFIGSATAGKSEYAFWAKRPVLSDLRPAACVTAVADSAGRFAFQE